jgi:hypothetical protein
LEILEPLRQLTDRVYVLSDFQDLLDTLDVHDALLNSNDDAFSRLLDLSADPDFIGSHPYYQ